MSIVVGHQDDETSLKDYFLLSLIAFGFAFGIYTAVRPIKNDIKATVIKESYDPQSHKYSLLLKRVEGFVPDTFSLAPFGFSVSALEEVVEEGDTLSFPSHPSKTYETMFTKNTYFGTIDVDRINVLK